MHTRTLDKRAFEPTCTSPKFLKAQLHGSRSSSSLNYITIAPAMFCMRTRMCHTHALNLGCMKHAFGDPYAQQLAVRLVFPQAPDPRTHLSGALKSASTFQKNWRQNYFRATAPLIVC